MKDNYLQLGTLQKAEGRKYICTVYLLSVTQMNKCMQYYLFQRITMIRQYWHFDNLRTGCQNVSHQQQQSLLGLYSWTQTVISHQGKICIVKYNRAILEMKVCSEWNCGAVLVGKWDTKIWYKTSWWRDNEAGA